MPRKAGAKATDKVKKVFDAFSNDPQLVRDLHRVFARAYEKAGVQLTNNEKARLFEKVGEAIGKAPKVVFITP